MTIPRMETISEQWRMSPPLSVTARLIAAALGVKFEAAARPEGLENDFSELAGLDGFAGGAKPDWLVAAEVAEREQQHG